MNHTDLIARLRLYGRPMMRGGDHPQSIVCREAADALTAAQERIEALEGAIADALGRFQITHVHEGLRAALDAGKG